MKKSVLVFATMVVIFMPTAAGAANKGDIIINEIAWMGTTTSANDEWMELKNTTNQPIDISGWTLKTEDEKIKISLKGIIKPNDFYLLERTDDNSVLNITANSIYTGALSNTGQNLLLEDQADTLIDQANFSDKWPAGNNTTKQTMERNSSDSWQTSQNPNGTPVTGIIIANQDSNDIKNIPNAPVKNPVLSIEYQKGIVINELLPAPEGKDETDEWIEIHNTNNITVDISGWKLQDTQGAQTTYVFPKDTLLLSNSYVVLPRPKTNITLNNDGDTIQLLFPSDIVVNSIEYPKAPTGQSYNDTASGLPAQAGWQWSSNLTPGAKNNISDPAAAKAKAGKTLPKTTKTANNENIQTASIASAIGEKTNQVFHNNPFILFLIVLAIIIIAGIIILILKYKNHVRT